MSKNPRLLAILIYTVAIVGEVILYLFGADWFNVGQGYWIGEYYSDGGWAVVAYEKKMLIVIGITIVLMAITVLALPKRRK